MVGRRRGGRGRERREVEFVGLREGWVKVKVRGRRREVVRGVRKRIWKKSRREGIFWWQRDRKQSK